MGMGHSRSTLYSTRSILALEIACMPTYWCLVTAPDNIAKTRALGFTVQGIKSGHRKKAEKMQPGDRIVVYATGRQAFAFTATITSEYFEDHEVIWTSDSRKRIILSVFTSRPTSCWTKRTTCRQ